MQCLSETSHNFSKGMVVDVPAMLVLQVRGPAQPLPVVLRLQLGLRIPTIRSLEHLWFHNPAILAVVRSLPPHEIYDNVHCAPLQATSRAYLWAGRLQESWASGMPHSRGCWMPRPQTPMKGWHRHGLPQVPIQAPTTSPPKSWFARSRN